MAAELGKNISILHRHCRSFFAENLSELKLSGGDYGPLIYLCENPGVSQETLGSRFAMTKGGVSKMLQRFVGRGLVEKHASTTDKRAYCLRPTPRAMELYPRLVDLRNRWNGIMMECLTEIERTAFDMLLRKAAVHVLARSEGGAAR